MRLLASSEVLLVGPGPSEALVRGKPDRILGAAMKAVSLERDLLLRDVVEKLTELSVRHNLSG